MVGVALMGWAAWLRRAMRVGSEVGSGLRTLVFLDLMVGFDYWTVRLDFLWSIDTLCTIEVVELVCYAV